MTDPRRQRVKELADLRGIPYGGLLPEELFAQAGYSGDEIDELFAEGNDEETEISTYHLQDETDNTALPLNVVILALHGTRSGKFAKTNHLINADLTSFSWHRELDRLIYNCAIERGGVSVMGTRQNRGNWFAGDQGYRRGDNLPYEFTNSIDEAVELFAGPVPNRIPRNPLGVCIAALSSWKERTK